MEWLLIVVVMEKRLEQQNTVETLNGDRDALKKEGRFFVLSWDRWNASSKGVDEINSWTIIIIIMWVCWTAPPVYTAISVCRSWNPVHLHDLSMCNVCSCELEHGGCWFVGRVTWTGKEGGVGGLSHAVHAFHAWWLYHVQWCVGGLVSAGHCTTRRRAPAYTIYMPRPVSARCRLVTACLLYMMRCQILQQFSK